MASDVLPDPDTPTTATVRQSGTSTSTSRRLLCRAPRTPMTAGKVSGTESSVSAIPDNLRPAQRGRRAWAGASGMDGSAGPLVEPQRLHDGERGGVGEFLDVRGGQHAGVLGDDGRGRGLGDRVQVSFDPEPDIRSGVHVEGHRV